MTHSFDKKYWDQIWQGDRAASMGASHTNPHLIQEITGLAVGSALEAGCGAGAEAIWLAQQGWQVTAVDVAEAALSVAAERAAASRVEDHVQWLPADLSVWEPAVQFDLVTTHYAHPAMPQLEFYDRIGSWVAPGGTLFIVGHGLQHGHGHGHGRGHGRGHGHEHGHEDGHEDGQPPASASVTAADITGRLDEAVWEVVTAQESQRTVAVTGAPDTAIYDVVVRAVRR